MGYLGGQESDWVSHLGEDLMEFGLEDKKEGGTWQTSALKHDEWFGKVEGGVGRFMRKWHAREAAASRGASDCGGVGGSGERAPSGAEEEQKRGAAESAPLTAPKRTRDRGVAAGVESTTPTGPKKKSNGGALAEGRGRNRKPPWKRPGWRRVSPTD